MAHVQPTHEFEEHTGEVALTVRAGTPADLFAEAARALAELMLGEHPDGVGSGCSDKVDLRSSDRTALFVDWLNELIFLTDVNQCVYSEIEVKRVSDHEDPGRGSRRAFAAAQDRGEGRDISRRARRTCGRFCASAHRARRLIPPLRSDERLQGTLPNPTI